MKLGDFGISRVLDSTTEAAVTVVGTPYYMSPEVCRSEPYNFKSDVWALGCILYELCMLKHAFESKSLLGLVYKIVSDHYDPVPDFYSISLNELIRRLLTKTADSRPTLQEVLEEANIVTVIQKLEEGEDRSSPIRQPPSLGGRKLERKNSMSAGESEPSTSAENIGPEIFMARVRRQLVLRKLNWMSAFASFDSKGDGLLSESAFLQCLTALHFSLSIEELGFLADWLSDAGGVSLAKFALRLNKAPESGAARVQSFARKHLAGAIIKSLEEACAIQDSQQEGVISTASFQEALTKVTPDISQRDATNLVLLSDKNLAGDVDYIQFLAGLREAPLPPQGPFPSKPKNLPPLPSNEQMATTFHTCQTMGPGGRGPFRAMSKEYFDVVCARMRRRLGTANLQIVCRLLCGGKEIASAETLLRLVSLVPLGLSRAEMQQICWYMARDATCMEEVHLAEIDQLIADADLALLSVNPDLLTVKRNLTVKATTENDLRRAFMTAQPSLTAACLDRLLFVMDKTADGHVMPDANEEVTETESTLSEPHMKQVQTRMLQVLNRCNLTQEDLRRITKIFDGKDLGVALAEQLPFRLSHQEAVGIIPSIDEDWKEEAVPAFDEQKVFEGLPEKISADEFAQRLATIGLPSELIFSQDKAPDGRILRPSMVTKIESPPYRRKSLFSRFLK